MPQNRFSEHYAAWRRDRIAELCRQGWTYAAIAAELGTTVKAVHGVLSRLRKAGADLPPPRKGGPVKKPSTATRHERILELRHQGQTLTAIAAELDMHPGSIAMVLSRLRKNGTNVPPPASNRGRKPTLKPLEDREKEAPE